MTLTHQILICQNTSCRNVGAKAVLAAFQQRVRAHPVAEVVACGCLGRCGNGPMVVVLPSESWYSKVKLEDVARLVERHRPMGTPIAESGCDR